MSRRLLVHLPSLNNQSSESKKPSPRAIESARQMSTNIKTETEKRRSAKPEFSERKHADSLGGLAILVLDAEGKTDMLNTAWMSLER